MIQLLDHTFLSQVLFLMLAAQETDHLHHQRQQCDLDEQEVHHLRLPPDLVCELDMLFFLL